MHKITISPVLHSTQNTVNILFNRQKPHNPLWFVQNVITFTWHALPVICTNKFVFLTSVIATTLTIFLRTPAASRFLAIIKKKRWVPSHFTWYMLIYTLYPINVRLFSAGCSMVVGLIPTTEKLSSKVGKASLVAGWVVKFWMVLNDATNPCF